MEGLSRVEDFGIETIKAENESKYRDVTDLADEFLNFLDIKKILDLICAINPSIKALDVDKIKEYSDKEKITLPKAAVFLNFLKEEDLKNFENPAQETSS